MKIFEVLKLTDSLPVWVVIVVVVASALLTAFPQWLLHRREIRKLQQDSEHHDEDLTQRLRDNWISRSQQLRQALADENERLRDRIDRMERDSEEEIEEVRKRYRERLGTVRDKVDLLEDRLEESEAKVQRLRKALHHLDEQNEQLREIAERFRDERNFLYEELDGAEDYSGLVEPTGATVEERLDEEGGDA